MKLVISAFPGCGKSTLFKEAEKYGLRPAYIRYDEREGVVYDLPTAPAGNVPVFDSDSSHFPKDNFPHNYIEHIKTVLNTYEDVVILVSSHDVVRDALVAGEIEYTLVYPNLFCKAEYVDRYIKDGAPVTFIDLLEDKWEEWIQSCDTDPALNKLVLNQGEFLVDKIQDSLPMPKEVIEMKDMSKTQMKTHLLDIEADLKTIKVVLAGKEQEHAGMESAAVLSTLLTEMSTKLGAKYGRVIPATLAGVEEFSQQLEKAEGYLVEQIAPVQAGEETTVTIEVEAEVTIDPAGNVVVTPEVEVKATEGEVATIIVTEPEVEAKIEPAKTEGEVAPVEVAAVVVAGTEDGEPVNQLAQIVAAVAEQPAVEPEVVEVIYNPATVVEQVLVGADTALISRPELVELQGDLEDDIALLSATVEQCQDETVRSGMEGYGDNGVVFTAVATQAKSRYDLEVLPTLGGMESFMEKLDALLTKTKEAIKSKLPASAKTVIGTFGGGVDKAADLYTSAAWLEKQKLINVGKVKISAPEVMETVTSPGDVKTIMTLLNKSIVSVFDERFKKDDAHLKASLKVFNKFKGMDPTPENIEAAKKEIAAIPAAQDSSEKIAPMFDLKLAGKTLELPVLTKDGISEVVDILKEMVKTNKYLGEKACAQFTQLVDDADWDKSKFWVKMRTDGGAQVWNSLVSPDESSPFDIFISYFPRLKPIPKFLEMWILKSVK